MYLIYDNELRKAERKLGGENTKPLEATIKLEELLDDLQTIQRGDRLENIKRRAFSGP